MKIKPLGIVSILLMAMLLSSVESQIRKRFSPFSCNSNLECEQEMGGGPCCLYMKQLSTGVESEIVESRHCRIR